MVESVDRLLLLGEKTLAVEDGEIQPAELHLLENPHRSIAHTIRLRAFKKVCHAEDDDSVRTLDVEALATSTGRSTLHQVTKSSLVALEISNCID
jgi:hypothetical protein